MVVERPVAEVTLPPPEGSLSDRDAAGVERAARALVWPQMCCCCGSADGLGSIPIYCQTTLGRNAIIHIPYCRRCQSHRHRASQRAFESATKVFVAGVTILLIMFTGGMLPDQIVGFLLQLLLVGGAVVWGARSYFIARAEIQRGMTPACSTAQTAAVRFHSLRPTGWRFRFFSQAYAEQFAAANPGGTVTSLDFEMPRDWTGRI